MVCLRLPSDSTLQWTPLPYWLCASLPTGALRTFTFKNNVRAGRIRSSPAYRGGGFLFRQKANRRFSFDDTTVSSISELSPCAPRFFLYSWSLQAVHKTHTLIPDIDCRIDIPVMVCTAFRQIHARIRRSFVSVFLYPHTLHSWLLAKKRPTFTSCFPCSSILYFRKFTNIPQPLSKTDLPKCSAQTLLSYRDLLYRRNHTHLQSSRLFAQKISAPGRYFHAFWQPGSAAFHGFGTFLHF